MSLSSERPRGQQRENRIRIKMGRAVGSPSPSRPPAVGSALGIGQNNQGWKDEGVGIRRAWNWPE